MVINYWEGGGGGRRGGGQMKFHPYKKGEGKVLAILRGGGGRAQQVSG